MVEITCPHCGKPIFDDEALLCHFCGESLQRAGSGFLSRLKYSDWKVLTAALAVLVIVSFLLIMSF